MIMGNTHDETTYLIGLRDTSLFNLTWNELPRKIFQYIKPFIGTISPDSIITKYRKLYPSYSPIDVFLPQQLLPVHGKEW